MPSVQIGKYKRPGIYIEEFNDSVIETPSVTGLQTIVIGSSKKGPINNPVLINSQNELDKIFGQLDRSLEANGSYFHRTISKLLGNTPVLAMNIMNVDSDLDSIEYKSLSTSSGYENNAKKKAPYSRFMDTSTFWERDRESFLGITKDDLDDDKRILHFTNLNDRQITMFIVKSQDTRGYDRTLLDWYGSGDKVPVYLNERDYASDYMVDVVILSGDWTNYNQLAVDPKWSRYFSRDGLVKNELFNMVNDQSINTLGSWRGLSLIPYFRDGNGANIFIEDKINQKTDVTGVYCAFDLDAVETVGANALFDLIGNSLIGNNSADEIDFLSYKDSVIETLSYPEVALDRPGNVLQLTFLDTYQTTIADRKGLFAENYVHDVKGTQAEDGTGLTGSGITGSTYNLNYTSTNGYSVIGGMKLDVSTTGFSYSSNNFAPKPDLYKKVVYIDTDGQIKNNEPVILTGNEIVLGKLEFKINTNTVSGGNYFDSLVYTPITLGATSGQGFVYYDETSDITATIVDDSITYEFLNTKGNPDVTDPIAYRKMKTFNDLSAVLTNANSDRATILVDDGKPRLSKNSVSELSIEIKNTSSANKQITLRGFFNGDGTIDTTTLTALKTDGLILHITDDELVMGNDGLRSFDTATYGVAGKYSSLYQDYYNGRINTGDYFYENIIEGMSFNFIELMDVEGQDYLVSNTEIPFLITNIIKLPESLLNKGELLLTDGIAHDFGATGPSASGAYKGYKITTDLVAEVINNPTKISSVNKIIYTRFYIDENSEMFLDFTDDKNVIGKSTNNKEMDIVSQNSNFRQTIEIETVAGYEVVPNKILISAARYPEVVVGNFLQAEVEDVDPRKMTRVLKKQQYSGDPTLIEITCDGEIKRYDFDGDLQTYRFTQIDDYVSTYKGISLFGFRVRNAALPDNTDSRLNDILNIVQKNTPLYNALTDKDIIDFRYLVDSYGLGLAANSKQQLADICGKRLDCFGILNMPSMKDFRNSSSPSFVDKENRLSVEYISMGGNPEESAAFNYSLADGDGSTSIGYFTPYVTVNDNGRPKQVPPAAYVATTFLRKHNTTLTSVTPWTVAAGITNGQVTSIAGLEYAFTGEDIEFLNGMSVNPIVSKRNRGRVIETENTAETLSNSALGIIHVREVLIEIERDLSDMLLAFQWRYNTPEVRAEIKLRADMICEDYANRNGLYNFFNKCDSENNTSEIIDNQMGVISTYLEIVKSMGVIVNNITILSTGGIESSGFK